jgi:hypothetical protein
MKEAVDRIKNLGRLSAGATGQGLRREGMLLGQMQESLSNDVNKMLNESGHGELASQLLDATSYYKNNVVPFWKNPEIRKSVTDKTYTSTGSKLSKALHDPNNESILKQLPHGAKETALYQLMTGGKGTSSGMSNLSSQEIGKIYSGLPVDTKKAIASYLPEADKYFEGLSGAHQAHEQLGGAQEYLRTQLQLEQKALAKESQKLETKIEKIGDKNSAKSEKLYTKMQKLDAKKEKIDTALKEELKTAKEKKAAVLNPANAKDKLVSDLLKAGALTADVTAALAHSPMLAAKLLAAQGAVSLGARGINKLLTSPRIRNSLLQRRGEPTRLNPKSKNALLLPATGVAVNNSLNKP